MIRHINTEIAIIGAGVIGMTVALHLVAEGHEVVLVDPGPPGMGASHGNAGTIAPYAVMPVGTPGVLRALPSLLLDPASPLAIRRAGLLSLAPWLARFAAQCLPAAARRNGVALSHLLASAAGGWEDLALHLGAVGLLQRRGALYLYETAAAFAAAGAEMAGRRGLGVEVDLIGRAALAALEPALPAAAGGGAFFPGALFVSDPGRMMARLAAHVAEKAAILQARAHTITRQFDGMIVEGPDLRVHARRVVIAAGAQSRALARSAGDRVPLDTERGYHVEWDMPRPLLSRPVCPTARGFYLCPMEGRLRAAGTVELGGLNAPPSPHRVAALVRGAQAIFPDLGPPERSWMGCRPSMPDSLPVIGPGRAAPEVIHAYGHGHLGLTLAPITGRIVADLVAERAPEIDITPFLPTRF